MPFVLNFLLRAVLVAAGLVFAASLALVFVLVLSWWALRSAWARLTGRPVTPFVVGLGPRGVFDEMMRRAQARQGRPPPRAGGASAVGRGSLADVTDVEPK
jgi:hypothetical protein